MLQHTNELTDEIIKACAKPPFTPEEIATFDESTRQEVLNLITRLATCPVKLIFRIATVGSLSRNGGIIQKVSGNSTAGALQIARVGDKVVYADGSEAAIISGAGKVRVMQGASAALVGSMLDNGDEIISTSQSSNTFVFREGHTLPEGFLTMPGSMH
ncbi:PAAR domain-containing protein [Atlantibacter sp.]|uniref:PAAR domain-containing protein n=1 Tax=Atlantibacter sp. TaxID=1903473 RepID=UPI00289CA59D|nr:PAAR domain-containing protein [Atlantibacter sp.]